ncbi:MAG: hypothetical protein WAX89_05235 [Alphaproteobacteria bacterium]
MGAPKFDMNDTSAPAVTMNDLLEMVLSGELHYADGSNVYRTRWECLLTGDLTSLFIRTADDNISCLDLYRPVSFSNASEKKSRLSGEGLRCASLLFETAKVVAAIKQAQACMAEVAKLSPLKAA